MLARFIRRRHKQNLTPAAIDRTTANQVVICQVCGGLANQMLCYKTGRYLSHRLGYALIIDTSWFNNDPADSNRNFQLGFFDIQYNLLVSESSVLESIEPKNGDMNLGGNKARDLSIAPDWIEQSLTEPASIVTCDLWTALALRPQVDAYVKSHGILDEFTLNLSEHFVEQDFECLQKIRSSRNPVAVHVRRGDFATHDGNLLLRDDYYNNAIGIIESQVEDTHFFIFSDDINWCKDSLKTGSSSICFVDFNNEQNGYKDMVLASKCKHFILSNASTFSHQIIELSNQDRESIVIRSSAADRETHSSAQNSEPS